MRLPGGDVVRRTGVVVTNSQYCDKQFEATKGNLACLLPTDTKSKSGCSGRVVGWRPNLWEGYVETLRSPHRGAFYHHCT